MSKTVIFLETSLTHSEATKILPNAVYMPSIKKGDVIRAIKNGHKRIVIIDGNFGWTPSVWHKEILIAIDYGIEVFGASSMGAIRAAELDVYGMKGVGIIYNMYKSGKIDGDDEVAIAFSSYKNIQTVPLINIRATLEALSMESKDEILQIIRGIHFVERTWEKIAEFLPLDISNLIQSNYVDIKRKDAVSVLKHIQALPPVKNKISSQTKINRKFTLFEKNLIESVFNSSIFNTIELERDGDFKQLVRAKNIIKFLSISKTRNNLLYYQSLIFLIDKKKYKITECEIIDQLNLFREENNLLLGNDFKNWLKKKYLFSSNLEVVLIDYIKLKKYLLISYNYNNYLR